MDPLAQLGQISEQTIAAIKAVLSGGGTQYVPGAGMVQKDITQATGLVAYNLEPQARLLVPAITPIRNMLPRVGNTKGGTAVNWKVITSIDINRARIFTAEGTKAATISYSVTDKSGSFKTMSAGDNVTFQAQWAGKTFEDVRARATARLLKHVLIREEQGLIGGRASALPAVTAPTVVVINGGGTVADATYNVFCRAIVPLPGSGTTAIGKFSGATSTGAIANGNDSIITASAPWVEGASRYEWYVGVGADANCKLEAVTRINSVSIPALAGTGESKATVDAAGNTDGAVPNSWDGLLTQLTASVSNVRTLATGTNGTGTALSLTDLDDMLQNAWDIYRSDPDVIFVNAQESRKVTNLVLAAAGAPTLFVSGGKEKGDITGGYRVTHYLSKVTGKQIPIVTHPYLEQGTVVGLSLSMPFPASDIDNPIEVETRQDYLQLDYPVTSPKWEFEVLLDELVKLYFPGSCFVIRNCNPTA